MIRDKTESLRACLRGDLADAIDALTMLNKYFGRETRSIAIGEISESLVASYTGAERRARNTKGHDLFNGTQLIEVKARLIDDYGDACQFNFRKYSAKAHIAFCLAWRIDQSNRPHLQQVFEVGVPYLLETWAKPNQPIYCARTTLGRLRQAAGTF